jgi:hydroxypyruvate reductase/glycerate 2-kinase
VDIIDHALQSADPYAAVNRWVKLKADVLSIGDLSFNLKDFERIFVIGAGKASRGIAQALDEILGDRITDGCFVLKHGDEGSLDHLRVIYAAHPIPDGNSQLGASALMELAKGCTQRDLVIAGISGGSSALLALPVPGVSLDDLKAVNRTLLLCGADIFQINSVRKHLSRIKGGWLAKAILPATLINLTVSDVVGDVLDYISGPTVPDSSTFNDARNVLDEYRLWDELPEPVAEYIRQGGRSNETPKSFEGLPLHTFVIVPGDAACTGAYQRAVELGFNTVILTSMLEGEAKVAGAFFAAIAKEIRQFGRPLEAPCAIIAGGENVVSMPAGNFGQGGPNQEFALSASIKIADLKNIVILSVDTDGSDGPTPTAGALVDGGSLSRAVTRGFSPGQALVDHDTANLIHQIGDDIVTGPTGTNVNDLKVLLVGLE